jgi:diguanylate cyclase (GGDEF)-like protein/PAS domain S-box-containing protein
MWGSLPRVLATHRKTEQMNRQAIRNWYMRSIALVGAVVTCWSVYALPVEQLDLRYPCLALVTIIIGSRITVQIPRAKGHISVSDTFIFLTMLMFGGEAAILLAALEAFTSTIRFSKRLMIALFNAGVMACATAASATIVNLAFGPLSTLPEGPLHTLVMALSVMALVQYGLNSGLVAVSAALKLNQPLWFTWRTNFLWTSITYFAGVSTAGFVARVIDHTGFYALVATAPIIAIIYLTYRTYLQNIETSAVQAEQAKLHVEELNRFISEQERISKALQESEEHFRTAFDYAAIGMALVSPGGAWLRVNRSLCDILGYPEEEFLNSDFQALTHRDDLGADLAHIYRMLAGEILTCQLEKRYIHKHGHEVWALTSASLVRDSQGEPLHFIFQIEDITERKRAEAAIQALSVVDELTGLYNRRGFLAFSEQHLASIQRTKKSLMVVYADLDGLKQINDSFGHMEGDRALTKTAQLLTETFRSSDVLGRLGGDEFTVFAAVEPDGGVESALDRLERKFASFNAAKTVPYTLSVSVGLAIMNPEEAETVEQLMARADKSMYENKRERKKTTQPLPAIDHLEAVA